MEDLKLKSLIDELNELTGKIISLSNFIVNSSEFNSLSQPHQFRLVRQLEHMNGYCNILQERVQYFYQ